MMYTSTKLNDEIFARNQKIGVLLLQLGTPDAPTKSALRRYLREFLSDPRVIELPRLQWYPILFGIILNTRPARSAKLYEKVWTEKGSPLFTITSAQAHKLQKRLDESGIDAIVDFGMRYGNPAIRKSLDGLIAKGCRKIIAIPMYPQYAAATTGSVCDALFPALLNERWVPTLRVAEPYYQAPKFIESVTGLIHERLQTLDWEPDRIVLSYHGIPKRYAEAGDPYPQMCVKTTQLIADSLRFPKDRIMHTYQSRFGKEPWLTPYTDETLEALPESGVKKILLVCPGFSADCLETIDEIGREARHTFMEAGGEKYALVPGVNEDDRFIECLKEIVKNLSVDWRASQESHSNNKEFSHAV